MAIQPPAIRDAALPLNTRNADKPAADKVATDKAAADKAAADNAAADNAAAVQTEDGHGEPA